MLAIARPQGAADDQLRGSPTPTATSTTSRTRRATCPICDVAVSNSFGFGGHNASIVVRRFGDAPRLQHRSVDV